MPRPGDSLTRALAGLMALLVILLPTANATAMPSVTSTAAAMTLITDGEDRASAAAPHRHSGAPCDGCEHPDNVACCLSCGCLVGDVPLIRPAARLSASVSLHCLM